MMSISESPGAIKCGSPRGPAADGRAPVSPRTTGRPDLLERLRARACWSRAPLRLDLTGWAALFHWGYSRAEAGRLLDELAAQGAIRFESAGTTAEIVLADGEAALV